MTEAKARGQGGKIWPDLRPPEGFKQGYSNPPRPGHTRSILGRAAPGAVQHALERGSKRITRINEGTRQGIRQRIQEAIEQGMTPAEAGDYVREWTGFDEYRAERIARTEMMFSYNDAAIGAYQEVGVQQVVADDGDEDEECAARHGQVFTLDEAEGIQDHPNGTLDWLPIDPGTTPTATQLALNQQRPIENASTKIGSTPPPRSGWVGQAAQALAPEPQALAMDPQVERIVTRWMEDAAKEAWEGRQVTGNWTTGETGLLTDNTTDGVFRFVSPQRPGGTLTVPSDLRAGKTFAKFIPEMDAEVIPFQDAVDAVRSGGNLRIVTPHGKYVELRPVGAHPDWNPDLGEYVRLMNKRMAEGQTWEDAANGALKEIAGDRAIIERGTFVVEKPIPAPPPSTTTVTTAPAPKAPRAPKAPKPKPGELPKDLQARANARLVDAPRDFKPAKHWDEAKARLKDHGMEMPDDFEMRVDDANDLLAAAERLKSEWPEDWDRMLRWEVGRSMGDSNAQAAYQGGFLNKSVVTLQRSKFDARGSDYYRRVVDSSRATGWYTREGYHGSTLIHEFGHVIDYTRNGGKRDLIARWVKELSPRTRTEGWVDWSSKKPGTWDIGVSGYGRTKWVENFAEAFVEAMTRPQSQWSHPTRVLWRLLHEPVV